MKPMMTSMAVIALAVISYLFFNTQTGVNEASIEATGAEARTIDTREQLPNAAPVTQSAGARNNVQMGQSDDFETSPEQAQSAASYLEQEDEYLVLSTQELKELSLHEFRQSIERLDYEKKTQRAFEAEYQLGLTLNSFRDVTHESISCSDTLCGVIFTGYDEESIVSALNEYSQQDEIRALSKGGMLRRVEEHGLHYGFVVLVIGGEQPVKLR